MKVRRQSNGIGSKSVLCIIITERSLFDFLDNIIPSLDVCLSSLVYCVRAYRTFLSFLFSFFVRLVCYYTHTYVLLPPFPSIFFCFPCEQSYLVHTQKRTRLYHFKVFLFFLLPLKQKKGKVGQWVGGWDLVCFLFSPIDFFVGGSGGYSIGSHPSVFFFFFNGS